jgi:outer membrane murein-binding lipoprotein Lpp
VAVRKWRTLFAAVGTAIGLLAGCTKVVGVEPRSTTSSTVSPGNANAASAIEACKADARAVETAAEAYRAQVGNYPTSITILTQTVVANGQSVGPWLRVAPSSAHYTIFVDPQTGSAEIFAPGTSQPSAFDESHNFNLGDPCSNFAS